MEELFSGYQAVTPEFKVLKTDKSGRLLSEKAIDEGEGENERSTKRGRRGETDPRGSRTVFVGSLPPTMTRRKLKQLFSQHGRVESVRLRSMVVEKGRLPVRVAKRKQQQITSSTINAYVVFSKEDEAEKAQALNGVLMGGRHIRVDSAVGGRDHHHQHDRSVFVGGLPYNVDEEEVREVFEKYGDVESVRVVREVKTGAGKGFGFVTFGDRSGVMFALQHGRGVELNGQKLRVMRSRDMTNTRGFDSTGAKYSGLQTGRVKRREGNESGRKNTGLKSGAKGRIGPTKLVKKSKERVVTVGQAKTARVGAGSGRERESSGVSSNAVRPSRLFHKKKEARQRQRGKKTQQLPRREGGSKGREARKSSQQETNKSNGHQN